MFSLYGKQICQTNQESGLYMMEKLVVKELIKTDVSNDLTLFNKLMLNIYSTILYQIHFI